MRKRAFLSILIMFSLCNMQNVNPIKYSYSEPSYISELKILSWNIYMLPYLSLFNNNDKRARLIAEKIKTSDYKIVVFQEAFSVKCRNILAKLLKSSYPYQYGPANKNYLPFKTSSGLWIISKIPLNKLDEIQFSVCKGFDKIARKGAVLYEGRYHGARFQLLATHLQAENASGLRSLQCHEIREKLLNSYYSEDVPQILCGDFNIDRSDTVHYHQMLKTLDATNGELSGPVQVTYDEQDNNLAFRKEGSKRIIDYVLVRNENQIKKMERKVQTFVTNMDGLISHLSDYYAIEVSLAFKNASDYISFKSNE